MKPPPTAVKATPAAAPPAPPRGWVRIGVFIAVGSSAAAVHWLSVVWLVSQQGWHPLVANGVGWIVAFGVSFGGHYCFTFRDHQAALPRSALRFLALSGAGFAINELSYAVLLGVGHGRYDIVLAGVLVAVAAGTFLLSRSWAFRRPAR